VVELQSGVQTAEGPSIVDAASAEGGERRKTKSKDERALSRAEAGVCFGPSRLSPNAVD